MNTCYIKCKRNVTLHEYDIYAILIPSPQTLRQAPYSIDGQIYYTLCAWCMLACVCVWLEINLMTVQQFVMCLMTRCLLDQLFNALIGHIM